MVQIDPVTLEPINLDTATKILVVQDETVQHSNDVQPVYWGTETMNFPAPKSQGVRLMSSDFITLLDGYLMYNEDAWDRVIDTEEIQERIKERGEFQAQIAGRILKNEWYNTESLTEDFVHET